MITPTPAPAGSSQDWIEPLPDGPSVPAAVAVDTKDHMRWFYQLQNISPAIVGKIDANVKVVDWTAGGADPWSPAAVNTMRGPKSTRLLAYVSIGEAEDYRPYWERNWKNTPPLWLGPENPEWKGNYKVRYWQAGWESIVMDMVDTVVKSGFDGIYLDIIDAYEFWMERARSAPEPDAGTYNKIYGLWMVQLVQKIAARARRTNPGFWVVPQNGEGLFVYPQYIKVIDAIGIEDLLYGEDEDADANDTSSTNARVMLLRTFYKPVLCVEYGLAYPAARAATVELRSHGFVPYITERELNKPTEPPK